MATHHHYGPGPWVSNLKKPDQNPVYFHRADAGGIGFDRMESGSNAIAQYTPEAGRALASDERYLIWFHHEPWDYRTSSGRTLWDELVVRYSRGIEEVAAMRRTWASLEGFVDPQRYRETADFLAIQEKEAKWWRDACVAYFQTFSKRPLPVGYAPPEHSLAWYQALEFPYAPAD
jgi:alpha-glucuronidase